MKPFQEEGAYNACIKIGQPTPKGFYGDDVGSRLSDKRRRSLLLCQTHRKHQVSPNRREEELLVARPHDVCPVLNVTWKSPLHSLLLFHGATLLPRKLAGPGQILGAGRPLTVAWYRGSDHTG